jgi:hypothetical protein
VKIGRLHGLYLTGNPGDCAWIQGDSHMGFSHPRCPAISGGIGGIFGPDAVPTGPAWPNSAPSYK